MKRWQITGVIATIVIVLSIPLYIFRVEIVDRENAMDNQTKEAVFVGGDSCVSCHEVETEKWRNSDHNKSMDLANLTTVLGDFNNAVFSHQGVTFRFFRRGEAFYVNTLDGDGQLKDFEITHTFGYNPLQQYLIPFGNGRLQCLSVAWDTEKKRWYHLNPDEKIASTDWLHWTKQSHNWNGMCAECHSTRLKKQFDPESNSYQTIWSEIDVNCETCHGPGSLHNEWAELPEMARPEIKNYGLVVKTSDLNPEQQIAVCARCHSRRLQLKDFDHSEKQLMDSIIPELLSEGLYHADGQILDEVYVYGSFVQSKMYHNDVKCSDCHDVHSGKPLLQDNDLCLQCHQAQVYDSKTHHFHRTKEEGGKPLTNKSGQVVSAVGEGSSCVNCHMPGQTYMGVDLRPDHSLRIPRPDLSIALGTPNACNQCHVDETLKWSDDHFTRWYGLSRKAHYGSVLAAGRLRKPAAETDLVRLAGDALYPDIVRATALQLLGSYPSEASRQAFDRALNDEQPLIRYAAVRYTSRHDPQQRKKQLAPLLNDPVRAVRMECAMSLATVPRNQLSGAEQKAFALAMAEYERAMTYSADFSFSGLNLGNLYYYQGKTNQSEKQYRAAIRIASGFNPAKLNLAVLLSGKGKNNEAETLLQEVIQTEPDSWEAHYKLGLLLIERKKVTAAIIHLEKAASGFGTRSRIYYNLGLLYQRLNRNANAESALLKAVSLAPDNADYLYGATYFYFNTRQFQKAKRMAQQLSERHPANPIGQKMLNLIEQRLKEP